MGDVPATRFARNGDVHIAYQVFGKGSVDLLLVDDWIHHVELSIRVGVHAGEVDLRGSDARGLAVHIAARVAALAEGGEVLVSSTVRDLLIGSGFEFETRGEHALRGVPDVWRLFAVRTGSAHPSRGDQA